MDLKDTMALTATLLFFILIELIFVIKCLGDIWGSVKRIEKIINPN